jgi:glutamate racemase
MDNRPIGVFDSGIGGLSILLELENTLPNENFIYLADQANFPYGSKTKKELVKITDWIVKYFISQNVKLIVIACNTDTLGSIEELRKKYKIPFVGTVPAVKPAAEKTKTGTIAVLSTPSTAKSPGLKKLIDEYCKGVKVLNIACPGLADIVESGKIKSKESKILLEKYLKPVKNSNADYLVLGCTHYSFLGEEIQKILGPKVKLIDSGAAIAKRTKQVLKDNRMLGGRKGKTTYLRTKVS